MKMSKKTIKRILDILITILTAIAATFGTVSCMGHQTPLTSWLGI